VCTQPGAMATVVIVVRVSTFALASRTPEPQERTSDRAVGFCTAEWWWLRAGAVLPRVDPEPGHGMCTNGRLRGCNNIIGAVGWSWSHANPWPAEARSDWVKLQCRACSRQRQRVRKRGESVHPQHCMSARLRGGRTACEDRGSGRGYVSSPGVDRVQTEQRTGGTGMHTCGCDVRLHRRGLGVRRHPC
jgi:hypothetical protein